MASQRDYYQILGVSETATTDEIKKAFRRLAKQYHPDRNPSNPQAADRFKEINEAHDVLSEAENETAISIPFRVAALGGKVPVTLTLPQVCPTCSGSGGAPGTTFSTCPECKGRGTISFGQGGFAVQRPCPVCRGRGKVPAQRCPTCQGSGEVRAQKHLTITIPPGTEDGTRLRLKGQGAKGRGDIVVAIQVEPDRFFRREGLDVIGVVPINLAQALLGSKIKVRTLDGKRVVLKVPPGTQHGQKFRIPGQGIERNGRRGDQYVEIHVQIPEKLSPEQEAAVREFAEKSGMKH